MSIWYCLLIFILSSAGLTQILAYGKIFEAIRPNHYFFNCPMCVGFWIGGIVFVVFWLTGIYLWVELISGICIFGGVSSLSSYYLCSLVNDDGVAVSITKKNTTYNSDLQKKEGQ
tara:strand:+ start:625 stop:969 length:345 start_codon:yes stop_codon:yes gene_type:complete